MPTSDALLIRDFSRNCPRRFKKGLVMGSLADGDNRINGTPQLALPKCVEQLVLGTLFQYPTEISAVVDRLMPTHFASRDYGDIFQAIIDLELEGKIPEPLLVAQRLPRNFPRQLLADCLDHSTALHLPEYVAQIIEEHDRRQLRIVVEEAESAVRDPSISLAEIVAGLTNRLATLGATPLQDHTAGFAYTAIDSATFAAGNYAPTWYVQSLLVKNQPCLIGAPRKSLKTSTMIDLAISLATASPFLGHFKVFRALNVAFLSGESGESATQSIALRVCEAKGIKLAEVPVFWSFTLPQLANKIDVATLIRGLKERRVEVVIIDPIYLCLSDGHLDVKNLFEVGPLLMRIAQSCLAIGVTPILVCHARKNLANNLLLPLEMEDLAYAGFQEFARQWILLNRREAYDLTQPGDHSLWMSAGGSMGHGGLWALDISEGELNENFAGRRWEVSVTKAADVIAAKMDAKDQQKIDRKERQNRDDETAVLNAMDTLDPKKKGATHSKIRAIAAIANDRAVAAEERLVLAKLIEPLEIKTATNKGRGFRRVDLNRENREGESGLSFPDNESESGESAP
jgi:hypothetical protein